MTTDEIVQELEDYVNWCREEGETDLRQILNKIKSIRKGLKAGKNEFLTSL